MKKILLPLFAVGMCVAPAFAQDYGTTPETAVPFPTGMGWFVPDLSAVPSEVWFTYTPTANVMWGAAPGNNPTLGKQVWVYLCDGGQEAFQRDGSEGTDSYALLSGRKYLVKITPKETGSYCMFSTPFPPAWEGMYKYYPMPLPAYSGEARTVQPGETKWFLYEAPYASQITTNTTASFGMAPDMNIEKVEAIHIECPGGSSVGTGMMGPYVKAGMNVIGVTVSSTATEASQFQLSVNAMVTLNCANNFSRSVGLVLDTPTSYPDSYYTVDKYFTVPEDGDYTFINHGAKGTLLNVGDVKVVDGIDGLGNPKKIYECDWTNIKTATVGENDAMIALTGLTKGQIIAVQSDAFGVIGEGPANLPYLTVVKGNQSGIADVVAEDGNTLKATVVGGKLNVESVLLASGAEVAVYDMLARKVASAVAADGAASLEINLDVNPGVYVVVVYGKGNSESAKIAVK